MQQVPRRSFLASRLRIISPFERTIAGKRESGERLAVQALVKPGLQSAIHAGKVHKMGQYASITTKTALNPFALTTLVYNLFVFNGLTDPHRTLSPLK